MYLNTNSERNINLNSIAKLPLSPSGLIRTQIFKNIHESAKNTTEFEVKKQLSTERASVKHKKHS